MLIDQKENCTGCFACANVCSANAIKLIENEEGFLYPNIDNAKCLNCGLCYKVCPVVHPSICRLPLNIYAVRHMDDNIRINSSSGGLFTALAEHALDMGGVVFGARFNDNWDVVHDYIERKEELALFRGSKYVQSNIRESYRQAETFLKNGRMVLFSGTPCQVSGLKKYLRKEYDNLLAVDFICHGVPSPKVWQMYLKEEIAGQDGARSSSTNNHIITNINFRDKSSGWKNYSLTLNFSKSTFLGEQQSVSSSMFADNPYMNLFLADIILRKSCYQCKMKSGASNSDCTIGDYWGIDKLDSHMDDDKGHNIVIVWSDKVEIENICDIYCVSRKNRYRDIILQNRSLVDSSKVNPNRPLFFYYLNKYNSFEKAYNRCFNNSIISKIFRRILRIFI